MKRIHYTSNSNFQLKQYQYDNVRETFKPKGLWYSIDDAWKDWCDYNEFRIESLCYQYELKVDESKILILKDIDSVILFKNNFSINYFNIVYGINWNKVQKQYSGIEIQNYEKHYIGSWYSGWDCSSGCIWDLSILELK